MSAYRVDGRSRPPYDPAMMVALLLGEQVGETAQIVRGGIRDDVEVARRADHAVGVDREAVDDDVADAGLVERPEQWLPG